MRAQPGFVPHVTELGSGPRHVLALHCTMAFGGAWSGMSKALGEGTTLVAPDMPSHGGSADWDEQSDFSDTVFVASIAAMAERPMDVIGHSFGAATALRLAVARPDLVRSLTVFEPVFFAAARWHDPQALGGDDLPDADYIEALKEGDRTRAARLFNGMWGDEGPGWNSLSERTQAAMARAVHVVPDTRAFLYDDTAGLLKPGGLDALPMPCIVMRGEHTQDAVVATNDALERIIPGARQVVVEGAGHMAPITHPDAVAAELKELLARS